MLHLRHVRKTCDEKRGEKHDWIFGKSKHVFSEVCLRKFHVYEWSEQFATGCRKSVGIRVHKVKYRTFAPVAVFGLTYIYNIVPLNRTFKYWTDFVHELHMNYPKTVGFFHMKMCTKLAVEKFLTKKNKYTYRNHVGWIFSIL